MKIDKKMMMGEILEKYPQLGEVLVEKYGLHCVGCPMGRVESLKDGATSHGMNSEQIEKMVKQLNKEVKKLDK